MGAAIAAAAAARMDVVTRATSWVDFTARSAGEANYITFMCFNNQTHVGASTNAPARYDVAGVSKFPDTTIQSTTRPM